MPALLSGGKVIVSTGTKTLQDQLFQRDLPLVRDALRVPVTVALLKGRANYVCHTISRAQPTGDVRVARRCARICRASSRLRARRQRGDKSELADVPENAAIWPTSRRRAKTASAASARTTTNAS